MKNLNTIISKNGREVLEFLKSAHFSRALLVGFAIAFPLILGINLGYFEVGLALCFGAFWSSPSDISGSFKHKRNGILISAALVTVVSFIGGYLHYQTWLTLPILGILGFSIAFISVFGFRASLISFSGLLALVLSFAHDAENIEIYQYALLIGAGGLWYLFLAKIRNFLNPKAETEELLTTCYQLTADFIETRGKLIDPKADRKRLEYKILQLQSELTENHKTLREALIVQRKSSGFSNYQDKRLLLFVQLVDMMETAIANPVNYDRMDLLFEKYPQQNALFQELILKMAKQLRIISDAENKVNKLPKNDVLNACLTKINVEINQFDKFQNIEEYLMLQNFLEYQEKQFKKLKRIKLLIGDSNTVEADFIDRKVAKRFLEAQEYHPKILLRNFSFKSNIFRHSLRLSITIMIAYALGSLLPFQNPYWILLTIVIIMRPNYGLTKSRAKDRTIGTILGGVFAYGMIFFIQDVYVFGVLGLVSLVFALSLVQKNSKLSAFFVTLSVVFIFAILTTDINAVVQFRIIDTLVGAVLSYAAMLFLWPSWESIGIKQSIKNSVLANKEFLLEISAYYQKKGAVPTSYPIARKEAFVQTSNLNAAFQRMAQEPKSKQNKMDENYELVVLNHNFLASLASLSSYIQYHKTTEASDRFRHVVEKIEQNMNEVLSCLSKQKAGKNSKNKVILDEKLPAFPALEIENLDSKNEQEIRNLQEAHLVWEQLQWLFNLSCKMLKLAQVLK